MPSVALVNNMPDAAFEDTEAQFRQVIQASSRGAVTDCQLFSLPGLVRSAPVAAAIRSRYRPIEQLWSERPDALIITGTEPSQASLLYEPYWPELATLLRWAAENVPATMLSCLASHASVLLFDGIERVPLAQKLHGVFSCEVPDPGDPLAQGLPGVPLMPHSRINDLPVEAMRAAGYTIVASNGDSWSVACRRQGGGMFVLCQGHPEYSRESLLREYRRDVRRALLGRGLFAYPVIPVGYLDADATAELEAFASWATRPGVDPAEMWDGFPYAAVAAGIENGWGQTSAALYGNWLSLAGAVSPSEPGA